MSAINCRTCPFADPIDEQVGRCRAEPPTLVVPEDEGELWGSWPQVYLDEDWCGSHPLIRKDTI